jgi:hypothetical protein
MSNFTSLDQLETAISETSDAIAAAEGAPATSAPESADSDAANAGLGYALGIHVLVDVLQAAAGVVSGPEASVDKKPATDLVTGRARPRESRFLGSTATVAAPRRAARDIMAAPGSRHIRDAKKKPAARYAGAPKPPRTAKGLDLDEAVELSGQSLNSTTRGLKASQATGASQAALKAQLQGMLHLRERPTSEIIASAPDDHRMQQSRFALPAEAQNRLDIQAPSAPKPVAAPAPRMAMPPA